MQVFRAVREACSALAYGDPKSTAQGWAVQVKFLSVWRGNQRANSEGPARGRHHVVSVAVAEFRCLPAKRALLAKFGLASHWSFARDSYWSAVRYVAVPLPKKPQACLGPAPVTWAATGVRLDVETCCRQPVTVAAIAAKRARAERRAAGQGKADPRVTEMDLWPIIAQARIRNTPDDRTGHLQLTQRAKAHCSMVARAFVFNRARLNSLIDDAWQRESVDDALQNARLGRLETLHAASQGPCVYNGVWLSFLVVSLMAIRIPSGELRRDVCEALRCGRGETTPVVVLGGMAGGEGKFVRV